MIVRIVETPTGEFQITDRGGTLRFPTLPPWHGVNKVVRAHNGRVHMTAELGEDGKLRLGEVVSEDRA